MNPHHEAADDMAEFGAALNNSEGYARHCTGPCRQGRDECPHPQACQQPDDQSISADSQAFPQLLVAAVLFVLLCVHVGYWLQGA